MIHINKKGRIIKGDLSGQYVLIQDDAENTGGYLILTATDIDFQHGHDDWVEDMEALERYFKEAQWQIEWLG
jgi:hypothetical protein